MNTKHLIGMVVAGVALMAGAAEPEQERETFGKWRIGFGGAFNAQVRSDLGMRRMPIPRRYSVPVGSTKADALARALARRYDGGGFIDSDSLDNGFDTENWKLPGYTYHGNGHFVPENAYQEVVGSSFGRRQWDESDDRCQFGLSAEISRELWIHDEEEEHRWGVDFAAAFSYFFARGIYNARGVSARTDTVRDGKYKTDVVDADTTYDYDTGRDRSDAQNMYGYGNSVRTFASPALGFVGIGSPYDAGGPTRDVTTGYRCQADGDYQELEMLFMLRPWYEITDWWRVFAEVGVGVSWGRFDSTFYCERRAYDEDFSQWDCYGVVGLGTVLRYKSFDIMIDFMGRFLRDDLEVDGRHVSGSIDRSDWGIRLMIGYEF